jgi:DNA-directed RNA polymerase subunit M/transcription elongation factor TFIIS
MAVPLGFVEEKCKRCGSNMTLMVEKGLVYLRCTECGYEEHLWSPRDGVDKLRQLEKKYGLEGVLETAVKVTSRFRQESGF